jgi:hypothetical protein
MDIQASRRGCSRRWHSSSNAFVVAQVGLGQAHHDIAVELVQVLARRPPASRFRLPRRPSSRMRTARPMARPLRSISRAAHRAPRFGQRFEEAVVEHRHQAVRAGVGDAGLGGHLAIGVGELGLSSEGHGHGAAEHRLLPECMCNTSLIGPAGRHLSRSWPRNSPVFSGARGGRAPSENGPAGPLFEDCGAGLATPCSSS